MAFTSSYTPGLIQQSEYYYGTPDVSLTGSFTGSFSGDGSQLTGISGGGGVPAGTVSGSAQITALGFVTSSATASFSTVVANPGSSGGGALSTVTIDGTNFSVGGGGGGSSIFTAGSGFQKTINNLIISESNATSSLTVINSGSTVFDVRGSVGQLFEVQDGLDGVLMSVNDISGIPILTVSSSGDVFLAAGSTLQGTAATASFVPGVTATFPFTGSGAISGSLNINGSGSGIFDVDGTVGQLFSVNDGLDGILMSVNDISGLPLFEVSSSGNINIHSGNISGSVASTASFGHLLVNGVSISGSGGGGGGGTNVVANPGGSPGTALTTITIGGSDFSVGSGGGGVPSGTVSGSAQITALGFVANSATSSFLIGSDTGSLGVTTILGGGLSIKNQGAQSYARFYCEASNAHYTELKAQPHALFSGNPVVLLPNYDLDFTKPKFEASITASADVSASAFIGDGSQLTGIVNTSETTATAGATLTINVDNVTFSAVTAQDESLTIAAPTGTAVNSQKLIIRLKDDGTGRSITYNSIFRAIGVTLPTTTTASKTLYLGCIYNDADTKWDVVAVTEEA